MGQIFTMPHYPSPYAKKRRGEVKKISSLLKTLIPAHKKQQNYLLHMALEWPSIINAHYAAFSSPEKIDFADSKKNQQGILHISVAPAYALFLDYEHDRLIAKVNAWFGYQAISRIKLRQSSLLEADSLEEEAPPVPSEKRKEKLPHLYSKDLEAISHDKLQEKLKKLHLALFKQKDPK